MKVVGLSKSRVVLVREIKQWDENRLSFGVDDVLHSCDHRYATPTLPRQATFGGVINEASFVFCGFLPKRDSNESRDRYVSSAAIRAAPIPVCGCFPL